MNLNLVVDPALVQALIHALVALSKSAPICAVTLIYVHGRKTKTARKGK